ncbi:6087_t:CDS:2, partial [Scutellospora calospora]
RKYNTDIVEYTEEYTSKTCGQCGTLNHTLGRSKRITGFLHPLIIADSVILITNDAFQCRSCKEYELKIYGCVMR